MKTFLRVIFTKILYRIPLKLLLVLLAIIAVFVASFSHAVDIPTASWYNNWGNDYVFDNQMYMYRSDVISTSTSSTEYNVVLDSDDFWFVCIKWNWNVTTQISFNNSDWYQIGTTSEYCFTTKKFYLKRTTSSSSSNNVSYSIFITKDSPLLTEYQYTSLECQTEYNLIPISSVDQNYCTTNNLCPACSTCPTCPVWSWGVSSLYINNILHVGAPIINMTIPEEIDWDYDYTMWGNNMNIDVVWYNVDYDAVQDIIDIQSYTPTSEEFQYVIWLLAPYTKIIILFVFLFIIWAWIKKPFKSKKL